MDAHSNQQEDKYDEYPWRLIFDVFYSHTLLWPEVPPRLTAVALWMERLIEFEVRRTLSMHQPILMP
jgi:hypothetical protein